jgi:formate dehydrogenase beta subunit
MPARDEEVEAAEREGVRFHFLVAPVRVIGDGRVTGLELIRQVAGEFDAGGRRRPVPAEGTEFTLGMDVVVSAVGQEPDLSCLGRNSSVEAGRGARLIVDGDLATTRAGVFAAGDAVLGPATVIEAVAQGNRVAESVAVYLCGDGRGPATNGRVYETIEQCFDLEPYSAAVRPQARELTVEKSRGNFAEAECALSEDAAQEECKRCLRCDLEWIEVMEAEHAVQPVNDAVARREEVWSR